MQRHATPCNAMQRRATKPALKADSIVQLEPMYEKFFSTSETIETT